MVKTSSVATGSATAAAAAIAPLIDWLVNGRLNWAMPSPVVLIVSAAAVTVGHLLVNLFNTLPPAPTRVTLEGGFARVGMLAALAVATVVGGCATAPGTEQLTPEQVAAQVCPVAQLTMASLATLENPPADLAKAQPVVAAACAPGAVVDLSSLQALANTALPALLRAADAAGLPPADHDRIVLVQLVLNGALMVAP